MVGVSLALQLAAVLPPATSILPGGGLPAAGATAEGQAGLPPLLRCALHRAELQLPPDLRKNAGLGRAAQWLCPIESIHVSSRGRFGSTLLQAADYGWPALGYVVENAWLGNALIQALYRQGRVEMLSPARVVAAAAEGGHAACGWKAQAASGLETRLCCWWRTAPVPDCASSWVWRCRRSPTGSTRWWRMSPSPSRTGAAPMSALPTRGRWRCCRCCRPPG